MLKPPAGENMVTYMQINGNVSIHTTSTDRLISEFII